MRFTAHCYTETVPVMDTSGLHAVRYSDPFLPLICLHLQHLTVDVAHLLEASASRTPCTHDFFSFSLTASSLSSLLIHPRHPRQKAIHINAFTFMIN